MKALNIGARPGLLGGEKSRVLRFFVAALCLPVLVGCATQPSQAPASSSSAEPLAESSTAFDEPWPLEFDQSELEAAAYVAASDFFEEVRSPSEQPVLLFADSTPSRIRDILNEVAVSSSEYLFPLIEGPVSLSYVVARDDAEVAQLLAETGLNIPLDNMCGWNASPNCTDWTELGWWPIQHSYWRANSPRTDLIANSAVIPHEWFHEVQFQKLSYDPNRISPTSLGIGVWIYEGSATFVDRVLTKKLGGNTRILQGCFDNTRPLSEHWMHDQSAYDLGAFASAYIVASVGFQPLLDFFIEIRNDRNWAEAFERAIGLTTEDFYEKFEQVRSNISLPQC